MKFKVLFGLLMMFGALTSMNAQSYLPADQAITNLEAALADLHNNNADLPTPNSSTTPNVVHTKSQQTASTNSTNSVYAAFITELIQAISDEKDSREGYNKTVANLASNVASRQTLLNGAKNYALGFIIY